MGSMSFRCIKRKVKEGKKRVEKLQSMRQYVEVVNETIIVERELDIFLARRNFLRTTV